MKASAVILAVNIGSSSLKFSTHPIARNNGAPSAEASILSGNIQGLEPGGKPFVSWSRNGVQHREELAAGHAADPFGTALAYLKAVIDREFGGLELLAVAHRVVHGGEKFVAPIRVTGAILDELRTLEPLAPLHQPHNLHGISAFMQILPGLPQIACFDTAFHATLSRIEKTLPLNKALYEQGIHRYGFHGLSYHYVSTRLAHHSKAARGRLLMAHLGNGSSLCACIDGRSFSTTMGFSAVGGLMMGTRCGDLDAGVMLHLVQKGMDARALEDLFYRQSGLKGISGISADMRTLRENGSEDAQLAIELYQRRVIHECGGLIAAMGGVDAIAFAGGIGENDRQLRADVCAKLACMGALLDAERNANAPREQIAPIHAEGSPVEIWVVPTDEGLIAAEQALALL